MDCYIDTKFRITKNQGPDEICVLNYEDDVLRKRADELSCKVVFFSSRTKLDNGIYMDGERNIYLADQGRDRIEYVATIKDVVYYNDSKGTNTDASKKALEAMENKTVLIAGGYDKGSEYDDWVEAFGDKIKCLVLLGATADKIEETARRHGFTNIRRVKSLQEAVVTASENADAGETVLLSPACASWDMFKSYEERGKLFKQYVKELR